MKRIFSAFLVHDCRKSDFVGKWCHIQQMVLLIGEKKSVMKGIFFNAFDEWVCTQRERRENNDENKLFINSRGGERSLWLLAFMNASKQFVLLMFVIDNNDYFLGVRNAGHNRSLFIRLSQRDWRRLQGFRFVASHRLRLCWKRFHLPRVSHLVKGSRESRFARL